MANVPHKVPLSACTPINDIHGGDSDSTKASKDAGDDTTKDDSLHHVLFPPFRYRYYMNFYEIRFANSLGIHVS